MTHPHLLLWTDDPSAGGVAQYNDTLLAGLAAESSKEQQFD